MLEFLMHGLRVSVWYAGIPVCVDVTMKTAATGFAFCVCVLCM